MTLVGAPVARLEGLEKVSGQARYAFERLPAGTLYGWPVQASVSRGRIVAIDHDACLALPGVVGLVTHENAPELAAVGDGEMLLMQSPDVAYRGQVVALVLAETLDTAREAAAALRITYRPVDADVEVVLGTDSPRLYAPKKVSLGFPTDVVRGDIEAGLAEAATTVDVTYSTPAVFNNPMEPHATVATFADGRLDIVDSTQSTGMVRNRIAALFSLAPDTVRVTAEHVGGAFGSKGSPRPCTVLAVIGTLATGRPVKVTYTRQMMFSIAGYRNPTISHMRLGADAEGRLTAVAHEAYSHTSTIQEFAEQIAVVTRHMYAAPHLLSTHRVAALDVPTPRNMRAPGECPGAYALESAMDELAIAAGIDPVELRIRNEPGTDPETGSPWSSRNLVDCLRRGADLFGWAGRDPRPAVRRVGRFLVGTGVAASVYPALTFPSGARVTALPGGRYRLGINATDVGTGARTVMVQIAADVLGTDAACVDVHIGDSDLPAASPGSGSSGTSSWGWAVHKACTELRERIAAGASIPRKGLTVEASTAEDVKAMAPRARFAYGAQFVEARVDLDSGEIVVPRMVGVFAAGRILNARTARSQFLGGMVMGLSMALHEAGVLDPGYGDYANHDFATYHIATNADTLDIKAEWLDETDPDVSPLGGKGIGEIGIVGTAAAVANAVWHATGVRVRDLPVQPDALLVAGLPAV
ncbi:xanthine dehydrogenase family protein molybdopterin-binding subunit [Streptomyces sp. NPDC058457]|uniref:xanthine dehydrogenase family protein molybdopterin-binding subunit n=1 Tax=Streptomyces sp. NPDC058457 TaxID=3346507 RepID=UPI00365C3A5B